MQQDNPYQNVKKICGIHKQFKGSGTFVRSAVSLVQDLPLQQSLQCSKETRALITSNIKRFQTSQLVVGYRGILIPLCILSNKKGKQSIQTCIIPITKKWIFPRIGKTQHSMAIYYLGGQRWACFAKNYKFSLWAEIGYLRYSIWSRFQLALTKLLFEFHN